MIKEKLEKDVRTYLRQQFGLNGGGMVSCNLKELLLGFAETREKRIVELEQQIEKMKKYGKLLLDICVVMGNNPYMIWAGLEKRVKVLWDKDEEERGLKMADDILDRLLKISAIEWAEISKWEQKINDRR